MTGDTDFGTSSVIEGADQPTATAVSAAVGIPCASGDTQAVAPPTDVAATATDTLDGAGDAQPTATAPAATAPSITLAATDDGSGQEIVSGAGFTPGETVTLCWNDPSLGSATATVGDDGAFTVALDAPTAGTGTLTLLAQGDGGDQAAVTASF